MLGQQMERDRITPIDPDVARSYNWLKSFLNTEEWESRKFRIENYLNNVLEVKIARENATELKPVAIYDDQIGWYLYLAEMYLYHPHKYEPIQGARVIPIFKRMGIDFDIIQSIRGINCRVRDLLFPNRKNADSGLFELLTGLLWARNGWEVHFIEEDPTRKTPDFRAILKGEEWYIECKRLAKSSQYSLRERKKWLSMWRHLVDLLVDYRMPIVLDIVFHVELINLPDSFLVDELFGKLKLVTSPCQLIDNEIWTVSVDYVDFDRVRTHLKRNFVKVPSDQLNELIAGRRDPNRGFTSAVLGKYVRIGEGVGNNQYLDDLSFAVGAFWSCDADEAIETKARDIRAHLASAVQQLPDSSKGVIHVGLETLDGWLVEAERYYRIIQTVQRFASEGKDLQWIYCHLFQSYAPPDQDWIFDETVYYFGKNHPGVVEPLKVRSMIVDANDVQSDGVHWMRDVP